LIEDITGSVSLTVFSKPYAEYKELLSSKEPVILTGRISEREDRDTELICERVELIPKNGVIRSQKQMKKGLYLKLKNIDDNIFAEVKTKLLEFNGNTPVIIYCTDNNRKLEAPKQLWVNPRNELISVLFDILGEENVKLVK
jgi:DNA polymerase-3 subunit alpha